MAAVVILGRAAERSACAAFLDAHRSRPARLVIEGEAGLGKSLLWAAVVDDARNAGAAVFTCRAAPVEASLAFSGLTDLIGQVGEPFLDELPAPQRAAVTVTTLRETGDRVDPRTLGLGVLSLLTVMAARGPVLIAIDDEPWLDAGTRSALAFALRRLRDLPVGLLTARRTPLDSAAAPSIDVVAADADRWQIRLRPLSATDMRQVLAHRGYDGFARPVVSRLVGMSGGNPLLALELARQLTQDGGRTLPEGAPLPERLREIAEARLVALPTDARVGALAVALASQPTTAILERLGLRTALEAAESAGVIQDDGGHLTFTHPILAAAAVRVMPAPQRRAMHQRLATVMADPESRARHLALSSTGPSEAVAVALETAAEGAANRGAVAAALELAELAVERSSRDPDHVGAWWRRRGLVGRLLHDAGDSAHAARVLAAVVDGAPDALTRAAAALSLTEVAYQIEDTALAIEMADRVLVDSQDDVELRARALLSMCELVDTPKEKMDRAQEAVALLAAHGTGLSSLRAWAQCAMVSARMQSGCGLDVAALDQALALERRDRRPRSDDQTALIRPVLLKWDDRPEEAYDALQDLRSLAEAEGNDGVVPYALGHLVGVLLRLGRPDEAGRAALQHEEWAATTGQVSQRRQAAFNRGLVALYAGDLDLATSALESMHAGLDLARAGTWERMAVNSLLGALASAREDAPAAVAAFDAWWQALAESHLRDPGVSRFHDDYVEALLDVGRVADAQAVTGELLSLAERIDRPPLMTLAARCQALVCVATGDRAAAHDWVVRSLDADAQRPRPVERGRTLLVLGMLHRRDRAKRLARDAFEEAVTRFAEAGAAVWLARAERELSRTGIRRAGTELTASELRVAELAAQGFTNRRIAQAAFVSVKTVEATLARVYRKLGISSRAELGAHMARMS